jgi:hypothetical protein
MIEGDLERAARHVAEALKLVEGFELPLGAWQVHATAAEIFEQRADSDLAQRHRTLSRSTILRIANSLAPEEKLRRTFLSAAPITKILEFQ